MTIREQIRRIAKAAPHLPIQALTGVVILVFGIPMLTMQMFDSGFIAWVETKATITDDKGVQERYMNGELEYFYSIGYEFNANGQHFIAFLEKGFEDRAWAEIELDVMLAESKSVALWYEKSNPSNTTFENEGPRWPIYLGLLVLLTLLLAYFRWLMLKYYELELAEENNRT